ncbi:hypothetical protein ACFWU5_13115 [Nocardia sp. NPDC058640]|uniref:hypothetical protein n=1 Tax=Nocardia sp. NPDC058640 TaxID=3346571 RepID=UPI003649DE98
MKPLSSDGGVIAPEAALATADAEMASSAMGALPLDTQAILDVPLMQVPDDLAAEEEAVFTLAQKITDEAQNGSMSPAGLGGLGGLGGGQPQDMLPSDILSGISHDASSALSGLQGTVAELTAPASAAAMTAFDQAKAALTGTSGGGASAAASPSAAAPTLPQDPVAALMNGVSLPALPGVDALFQPFLDLLSSFGTGVFNSVDPTAILSQSSAVIEQAMSLAQGGVKTVQQLWEGQAADAATTASQQAQTQGQETGQRGIDISALTQQAAAVVQTGNAQLTTIATTFAAQATALAPTIMLPPTQATLIGLATTHLGEAVSVVNITRGQLMGYTGELSNVVGQLASQSGLPSPEEALSAVSENIGEPLMTQAQEALGGGDGSTAAAGANPSTGAPGSTVPAGLGSGGSGGSGGGGGGGAALGALGAARGGGGGAGGGAGVPSAGTPKSSAAIPGSAVPAGRAMTPGGMGATSAAGAGGTSGMMGGGAGAGAGRGNNEEEHGRNVQFYQSRTGNDDLTGPLGESTPEVIGAVHEDEREPEADRF